MAINRNFSLTISTLTPLHIGTGSTLREGLDFISENGKIWVANQGAILKHVMPKAGEVSPQTARKIAELTLDQMRDPNVNWLTDEDINLQNGLFRYALAGTTSTAEHQGLLYEMLKNHEYRPYLPGSSLKGAIRSELLKAHVNQNNLRIDFQDSRFAAQIIEKNTFVPNAQQHQGRAPNYSLWRAVKIADSALLSPEDLVIARITVLGMNSEGKAGASDLDLDFEVLPAGKTLSTSYQVEERLFKLPVRAGAEQYSLRFTPGHLRWFTDDLCPAINEQAKLRLDLDIEFFEALKESQSPEHPLDLVTTIAAIKQLKSSIDALQPDEMMLPVGRGTGWLSKTLGVILQDNLAEETFKQMVKKFHLGKGQWKQDEMIPYTRMLATCGDQLRVPMGWVRIAVDEVK